MPTVEPDSTPAVESDARAADSGTVETRRQRAALGLPVRWPGPRRTGGPRSRGRAVAGWTDGERSTAGDVELQGDEVEPGRGLGHRVLDLQARVHLEEEEAPVVVREELDGAGARVVDRAGRGDRRRRTAPRASRRPVRPAATAPPRPPSGAVVGSSTPARPPPTPCRARRPSPAPRCGGPWRGTARRTPWRRRTPIAASAAASSSSAGRSSRSRTTRMPRPPPPADALISTGRSASVSVAGSSWSSTGTPAAAISFLASILEPIASIAAGGGPIQVSPAACTARRELGVLRQEPVAGVDGVGAGAPRRVDDQRRARR